MTPTGSPPLALFDTNVLVYAADSSAPQHTQAKALRDSVETGRLRGVVTPQILLEFFAVVTGTRVSSPRSPAVALSEITSLAQVFEILPTPADLIDRVDALAVHVSVKGPEIYDLAIAATALQSGVAVVYTYDLGVFGRVPGLTPLRP